MTIVIGTRKGEVDDADAPRWLWWAVRLTHRVNKPICVRYGHRSIGGILCNRCGEYLANRP